MKVKLPFEPSSLGQVVGCAALDDNEHLINSLKINHSEKNKLESFYKDIGIDYIKSSTNFLTLKLSSANISEQFCDQLLQRGIIVRNLTSFGLPDCVRVTIGNTIENKKFISKIKKLCDV